MEFVDKFKTGLSIWNLNSLRTRLIILITGLIILTSTSLGFLYTHSANDIILSQYSKQRLLQEQTQSNTLFEGIHRAERDLHYIKYGPVFQNLIDRLERGQRNGLTKAKENLQDSFAAFIRTNPDYMQMRLIGVFNGGREIVRVDRREDKIQTITGNQLQNKSRRDYYQEMLQLSPGQIYTSKVNLNREHGKISTPVTPTVRIGLPIFITNNRLFALLIINIDLSHAFATMKQQIEPGTQLYVINRDGDYLVNPDPAKEFSFDYGRRNRLQDDFPFLKKHLQNIDQNGYDGSFLLHGNKYYIHAYPLAADAKLGLNSMIALQIIPQKALFSDIKSTANAGKILAIVIIAASLLFAILFANRILAPISFLTKATTSAAKGNYISTEFPGGTSEVGILSDVFQSMIKNIRERESDLRDNKARYQAIFSGAEDNIVIVNAKGEIEEANHAFIELSGYSHDELLQLNIRHFLSRQDKNLKEFKCKTDDCRLKQLFIGNNEVKTRYSGDVPVTSSIHQFTTSSGRHFAVYLHDLRTQKQAEEDRLNLILKLKQAQKLESVGLLASGIAHDFNNVLTCITGYSELMQSSDPKLEKDRDTFLREILGAAERARRMIGNLMKFSKNSDIDQETSDMQETTMEIISVLEHALTSRIMLTHDINLENISVNIPPFQVQQIILNLCINARDAMENQGAIHIDGNIDESESLQCSSCSKHFDGENLHLTVRDEGPGISADKIQRLFEPFYTTKSADKGTGLGLYMVQQIVHDAGGHVLVESIPGEFCAFHLYLPYKASESPRDLEPLNRKNIQDVG